MFARILSIAVMVLLIAAGTAGIVALHRTHRRLEQRVAALQERNSQSAALRERNQRLQSDLARAQAGDAEARRSLQAELIRSRAQVAQLQEDADAQRAKRLAAAAALAETLANNRDPEKGLVRLEHFQNIGRATPNSAFQTLVWAMMKGDDETAASLLSLSAPAREKMAAFIASLPEGMQARYPTPEKLASLVFAKVMLTQTAVQVLGQDQTGPLNANLHLAGLEGGTETVPFQLGPNGWQAVVPDGALKKFQNELNKAGGPVNKW